MAPQTHQGITTKNRSAKRQPQLVQVLPSRPKDCLLEIMAQVKPELREAVEETTKRMDLYYTGTIVISSNNPNVETDFNRQKRKTIDIRGLNEQTRIPFTPEPDTVESAFQEAVDACEKWIAAILARLKAESDISSMELIVMFRRETGARTGRLYARKEVLNSKLS